LHVPVHAKAQAEQTTHYFSDMREGITYVRHHAYLKHFLFFCAFFMFLAAPASFLTPLQVARSFGSDIWRLTAIEVTFSIGMILGGIVMASWGGFKNRIHSITLASLVLVPVHSPLGDDRKYDDASGNAFILTIIGYYQN
jgi:DHA3 family macrolide efflux protein-like MFS transporter